MFTNGLPHSYELITTLIFRAIYRCQIYQSYSSYFNQHRSFMQNVPHFIIMIAYLRWLCWPVYDQFLTCSNDGSLPCKHRTGVMTTTKKERICQSRAMITSCRDWTNFQNWSNLLSHLKEPDFSNALDHYAEIGPIFKICPIFYPLKAQWTLIIKTIAPLPQ